MTLVVDASFVVAALLSSDPEGVWADELLGTEPVAAPHLMAVESANIMRRAVLTGEVSADSAALAHADLLALPVEYFPYEPFGLRVWELRDNISSYDAWHVAVAELLGAPLATLDEKLARATGPRCEFRTPPVIPGQ